MKMKKQLIRIIETHPSLDNKLHLIDDVTSLFEQIELMQLEKRQLLEQMMKAEKKIKKKTPSRRLKFTSDFV
jgi:hypothetical protein